VDLYRVADRSRDLESIGIPDALEGAPVAVEWPGEVAGRLLPATIEVLLERRRDEEGRWIRVTRREPGARSC